jgi:hypothetical protein
MKASTCSCGCASTGPLCDHGTLERPRYFPRQLITPVELTLEQQYFRDKQRRHNRLLHGWGVACGAQVCVVADSGTHDVTPWMVSVQPGYILGPYGDEILIERPQAVDLRSAGAAAGGDCDDSPQPSDPWCADVLVKRTAGRLYVAVRYQETMCRQVRVQPTGCGCDDAQCEYSRWHDGFAIGILTQCPADQQTAPSFDNLFKDAPLPGCPDCPASPWVVLAGVDVDDQGVVQLIDNCHCRRNLVIFSNLWWQCTETPLGLDVKAEPANPQAGKAVTVNVAVKQPPPPQAPRLLPPDTGADLGADVTVGKLELSADRKSAVVTAAISPRAQPGPRRLRLNQANGCVVAAVDSVFTVAPTAAVAGASGPAPAGAGSGAGSGSGLGSGSTPQPAPPQPPPIAAPPSAPAAPAQPAPLASAQTAPAAPAQPAAQSAASEDAAGGAAGAPSRRKPRPPSPQNK